MTAAQAYYWTKILYQLKQGGVMEVPMLFLIVAAAVIPL
jgi:hypothetical protein